MRNYNHIRYVQHLLLRLKVYDPPFSMFVFVFLPLAAGGSDAKGGGAANSLGGRRAFAEHADSVRHHRPHEGRVEWMRFYYVFIKDGSG